MWNGTTWTQLTTANAPSPRYYNTMASNGAGQVLLFGGCDPTLGYLGDTWLLNGTNWSQVSPATPPIARGFAAMVWDSANGRYLLSSGTNSFFTAFEDTWTFAAGQWAQLATPEWVPRHRSAGVARAPEPARSRHDVRSARRLVQFGDRYRRTRSVDDNEDIEIIRKMAVRYGDPEIANVLNRLGRHTGKQRTRSSRAGRRSSSCSGSGGRHS